MTEYPYAGSRTVNQTPPPPVNPDESLFQQITRQTPKPAGRTWKLKLTVENGRKWLSLNDRDHYRTRAKKTKAWRAYTEHAVRAAGVPTLARATITGHIYKNRAGRYDPHNLFATLKPIIDGIVDAGTLADDDHTHLRAALEHGGIDRTQPPHIIITIREETT